MSIVVLHLRWDHLTPDQRSAAHACLDGLDRRDPSGACWSAECRDRGEAVLATVVWDSEASASSFSRALSSGSYAGLPEPFSVAFGVPALFAPGYRRPRPVVPAPRATVDEAVAVRA